MNPKVDQYVVDGCGRCEFYMTPRCKVNDWREELIHLRALAQQSGLAEDFKWKQPCYTLDGKNVLLVTAFREFACIAFFKGALLKDPQGLLTAPGEQSQAARQLRFTSVEEITANEKVIAAYIKEAIALEKAGKKVEFKREPEAFPEELTQKLEEDADLKAAFMALTPGRQRSYLMHFNQTKNPATRISRIEKCIPKILDGLGFNEYPKSC